jgi:hypothetical protein
MSRFLESDFEDRRALTWPVALRGLLRAVRRLADAPRGKFSAEVKALAARDL